MSLTNGLYNIMAPKNNAPPACNKAAKLVMTVEVETVQVRDEETGEVLPSEKHYPYYPLVHRKVEQVGGGPGDDIPQPSSSSVTSVTASLARPRRSSNGSSKSSSASSRLSPSSWWEWSSPSSDSDVGSDLRQEDEQFEVLDGIKEEEEDEVEMGGSPGGSTSASLRSTTSLASGITSSTASTGSAAGKKRMKFISRPRDRPDVV